MSKNRAGSDKSAIAQTQCWLKTVIVEHDFCPFAKRELERGSIRYSVDHSNDLASALQVVIDECVYLDNNEATETTLLIFTQAFNRFDGYLELVELAQALLTDQGYAGTYQLASFHPDYCFADAEQDDAANYTNRSPYPMLHLIREVSMEQALKHHPDPEAIPERNIEYARELGQEEMQRQLEACCKIDE